jgi:transposase
MSFTRKIKVGGRIYLQEVESVWENGKSKHKYIRTIGKEVDSKKILSGSVENSDVTKVTIYGPLLVLDSISREINLPEILREYAAEILSMAYSHCIDPKSLNKMEEWFSKTELNHILNLQNLTEKKLIDSLDWISNDKRNESLQDDIFRSINSIYELEKNSFFYDVTNVYFFGSSCKIAKRSKSKEGGFKKLIQIGLAVTDEGFPVFHKVFPGDVFDARTLFDVMKTISYTGVKFPFLIWDRGVSSRVNISDARKLGFQVICGLANKGKLPKEVDEVLQNNNFISPKNRVQLKESSFYVHIKSYKCEFVPGYLYICLNRKQQVELQEKRLMEIEKAKELVIEKKPIEESMKKYFSKKMNILDKIVQEEAKYDGISIIFSTKKLEKNKLVKKYFDKDIVEKAFACLKGVIKVRPIRKWLEERVKAHIFICYLSYLLLSILNYKLEKHGMNMGAVEAMEKLETLYKVYLHDNRTNNDFIKTVALTKPQEEILKAINKRLLKPSN